MIFLVYHICNSQLLSVTYFFILLSKLFWRENITVFLPSHNPVQRFWVEDIAPISLFWFAKVEAVVAGQNEPENRIQIRREKLSWHCSVSKINFSVDDIIHSNQEDFWKRRLIISWIICVITCTWLRIGLIQKMNNLWDYQI